MFRSTLVLVIVFSLCFSVNAFAQKKKKSKVLEVSVLVKDEVNKPMEGVLIHMKGTSFSFPTNKEGKYKFNTITSGQDTMVFTFDGYLKQEIPVDGKGEFIITMKKEKEVSEKR